MKAYQVTISSYKQAQHYKKDFVRLGGKFEKFEKGSGKHKRCTLLVGEGDEFDARASIYTQGATKYNAHKCQSWAKFEVTNDGIQAKDFDGNTVPIPNWITITEIEIED